jgi:hypothetical protein
LPLAPSDLERIWVSALRTLGFENRPLRGITYALPLDLSGLYNASKYLTIAAGFVRFDGVLQVPTLGSCSRK